jgi:hypothetical protein
MKVGDFSANGQAKTGTRWFCSEEGLENLCSNRRINSCAFVNYADDDVIERHAAGNMLYLDSDRTAIRHGFDRVPKEVDEQLD